MVWKLCLPILVLASEAFTQLDRIRVDADSHWLYDTDGRVVLFHGINSVNKSFPWYFDHMFNETRMDDLKDFGFNIVRLGSMWTGAEPEEGVFNETYIGILGDIVRNLESRGIYTVLDMHQDVLSSYYGSYDGVPPWLIDYFPPPTNPYPWPLDDVIFWEQGYLTQACSEGFQFMYNNTDDAVLKWANFWVKMADTFKDNAAVLGYEYMNEPWIGDYFQDESLRLPGIAGEENLLPAYDVITEAIRQVDPGNGIVFYEPVIYGQLFSGDLAGSGFDRVPGGEVYRNLSVFSWHAYCWPMEFLDSNATDADKEEAIETCLEQLIPQFFRAAHENMNKTGGGGMLTEFGLCKGYDRPEDIDMPCDGFLDLADEFLHSWVEWDYNDGAWYDFDGNRNWGKILPYVRPYARRTAGIPEYMYFDKDTLTFEFQYSAKLDIQAPTEIVFPEARYPGGFEVTSLSEGFSSTIEGRLLYISALRENTDQTDVTIIVDAILH